MRLPNRFRASKTASRLRRLLLRRFDVFRVHRIIPPPDGWVTFDGLIGDTDSVVSYGVKIDPPTEEA